MNTDQIKAQVRSILANTLKVDAHTIDDDASQANLSDWDSVKHMNVVLAVENNFGIEFRDAELPTLNSVPVIVAAVERHLAG